VVFDADVAASILDGTIGKATELDRAMGYEANAGGTSFLGPDPMALLGAFKVGSSMVNVTADRTTPGGLSTVKWDDEGVSAHEFSLVKDGVVVDYQTTRESSAWLAPWYEKQGKPVASHGCAAAQAGDAITMQHRPNLRLEPATADVTRDDLIKQVKKGMFFGHSDVSTDFQARSGLGVSGHAREIVNGTLGARLPQSAFSFDTVELWKNVIGIGGRSSQRRIQAAAVKGQPGQRSFHSATAAPMSVTGVAVIDPMRKA
jgi:TldD protein